VLRPLVGAVCDAPPLFTFSHFWVFCSMLYHSLCWATRFGVDTLCRFILLLRKRFTKSVDQQIVSKFKRERKGDRRTSLCRKRGSKRKTRGGCGEVGLPFPAVAHPRPSSSIFHIFLFVWFYRLVWEQFFGVDTICSFILLYGSAFTKRVDPTKSVTSRNQ
jgi:hypothetical protein